MSERFAGASRLVRLAAPMWVLISALTLSGCALWPVGAPGGRAATTSVPTGSAAASAASAASGASVAVAGIAASDSAVASGAASAAPAAPAAVPASGPIPQTDLDAPDAATPADAAASAPRRRQPAVVPRLEVVAPSPLDEVLSTYLDLARALASPEAPDIRESEWARLISAAPAQARQLAQTEGFFDAQVSTSRDEGQPPLVRLTLSPGSAVSVGRLTFEIQGELADAGEQGDADARALADSLRSRWPLQPGQPFRNGEWADAKNAVLARLRAEGYAIATWSGTGAQVDLATGQVRLFVVVDSGPLFRAGPIEVEGLVHHEAERVRALAGFATGTPLTETRLLDYQERLVKTGLFDQVAVTLEPDPAQAGATRVRVLLKESSLQAATVAVGISANSGPRTTLEHVHRHVFGWAASTRNKFEWGRDRQAWDGEISSHPDGDFRRWLLGGAVERLVTDTDIVLSQRLRLGRAQEAPERDRLLFVEGERAHECSRLLSGAAACEDLQALSLNQHTTWRALDSVILPTRGHTLNLQLGVGSASGSRTENGPFVRLYGRATGYWPLGDTWYSQARLELGGVLSRSTVVVPDSLRFRAGGDESVRGYPWRTLAPLNADGSTSGGKLLFTASAEIARPVSPRLPSVWWAAFVDAGRAADELKDLNPALGYGVGVRWRSPVGPLKLDLAWGQELQKARLHLSVGIAF